MLKEAGEADAARANAGAMPVVEERIYRMANFAFAIMDENPVVIFDTPENPGVRRHSFPFTWEALDNYIRTMTKFREENGPK